MPGFQVKIVLEGAAPPLWRRVLLPDQLSFADLHYILQIVFGWEEEHLHEFSFQHSRIIVSDMEYMDADVDEKEISADEYLRDGWIRYTYDLGDDWKHKITLEKEVTDYDKRYPTVIKHKRNNMEEDSGGVWGGEECRIPYDEAAVNSLLEAKCVCKPLMSQGFQKQNELKKQKEMDKLLQQIFKNLKIKQKKHSAKKSSDLERKLDKIHSFYEDCGIESSDIPIELLNEEQAAETGQLVFNFETGQTDVEPDLPDFTICKCESNLTQEVLLEQGAEKLIFDYAKYLLIPQNKNRGKKDTIKVILGVMNEHPEYYMTFLDEDMVQTYLSSIHKKAGEAISSVTEKSMVVLCSWGLWDARFFDIHGKKRIEISIAKGNESLLQFLTTQKLHQYYSKRKIISDGIFCILQSYGFMELSALHSKYQKAFGVIPYEELMRYLYIDGRFYGNFMTGECMIDNVPVPFAAVDGLDPELVLEDMKVYGSNLEYADFKNRQLLKWKEGIGSFIPAWNNLAGTLIDMNLVYPEELEVFLPELYLDTLSGLELSELLEIFENAMIDNPKDPMDMLYLTSIWLDMTECWLDTPLACLKGYSRRGLARRTGKDQFTIATDYDEETDIGVDELEGDEQIYELPWTMQQELFYLLSDGSLKKQKAVAKLREIAKGIGRKMAVFEVLEKMFLLHG
ncbi:plasmid pRiA4b ORF-3 family protein [Eisenbergiella sp.]